MRSILPKQISKVLTTPRKNKRHEEKTVTIDCTKDHSTESLLLQLQNLRAIDNSNKNNAGDGDVTKLILKDMLQRPDNVRLFNAIQSLLMNEREEDGVSAFSALRSILLVEPHVRGQDYRRWCYKKTNFLHHVYKGARALRIDVRIQGTLILEQDNSLPDKSEQVAGILSVLEQLPQDPDITSLLLSLEDHPVVLLNNSSCGEKTKNNNRRRPSVLELQQSPVQNVFSALIELFNSDVRSWKIIHCHILYDPKVSQIQQEQTRSLLEVADLYHIPLQVQWQVKGTYDDCDDSSLIPKNSCVSAATTPHKFTKKDPLNEHEHEHEEDSVTASSTTDHEFSSGALMIA